MITLKNLKNIYKTLLNFEEWHAKGMVRRQAISNCKDCLAILHQYRKNSEKEDEQSKIVAIIQQYLEYAIQIDGNKLTIKDNE